MLTPGEGVLTVGEMALLGGSAGFNALRAGIRVGNSGVIELMSNTILDGRVIATRVQRYLSRDLQTRRKLSAA